MEILDLKEIKSRALDPPEAINLLLIVREENRYVIKLEQKTAKNI